MNKILKRILPCLLIAFIVLTFVSCKETADKYKYPTKFPQLTQAEGEKVFVDINGYKLTNKEVFNRLVQGYGLDTLVDIIDADLLGTTLTSEEEEEYNGYLDEIKYGTKDVSSLTNEEKEEKMKQFEVTMTSEGLLFDEAHKADPLYYANYYKLAFKRYKETLKAFTEEINKQNELAKTDDSVNPYFAQEDYLNYFTTNYHKHYKVIIVTFNSELEAREALASSNVLLSSMPGAWRDNLGNTLTEEQVKQVFETIATEANQEGVKDYTYPELKDFSSSKTKDNTIASRVATLSTTSLDARYTHAPLSYGSRWYMAYVVEESNEYFNDVDSTKKFDKALVKEFNANNTPTKLTEELEKGLFDELVLSKLSSDTTAYQNRIDKTMMELRSNAGMVIYSEGIETTYKNNYDKVFKALSITDYKEFKQTTEESSDIVAKWNDKTVTVDNLFDKLQKRYGALVTLLFIEKYIVLSKDNSVVDINNNMAVVNNEKYQEYVKSDFNTYKESFDKGSFEAYGFGKNYGWENFLRDYVGIESEINVVTDYEGTLYNDILKNFKKSVYRTEATEVVVTIKDNGDDKTYWLSSPSWNEEYNTNVVVVDETKRAEVVALWSLDDYKVTDAEKKDVKLNDVYGKFALRIDGVDSLTNVTVDQKVIEKYNELFTNTFEATVSGVYVYHDVNNDGIADDLNEEDSGLAKDLAAKLINKTYLYSKDHDIRGSITGVNDRTIADNLKTVIREYNNSDLSSPYAVYKNAGLRVEVINNATYTNKTNADENLLACIKENWEDIMNYSDIEGTETESTKITDYSLDPVYRYVKNHIVYWVSPYSVSDAPKAVYADNGAYFVIVTKAVRKANQFVSNKAGVYPTVYEYEQSLLASDKRDHAISSDIQKLITAYYTPAINEFTSEDVMTKLMMNACKDLLANVKFTKDNDLHIASLTLIIEESLAEVAK